MSPLIFSVFKSLYKNIHCILRKSIYYFVILLFTSLNMATAAESLSKGPLVSITSNSNNETLTVAYSQALYQFNNQSDNWQPIALPDPTVVLTGVTVNKTNDVIFIATQRQGIFFSKDKGKNWVSRNNGLASNTITALTQHAQQPDTLYSVVPEQGIYRTEDAGNNWLLMDAGPIEMGNTIIHSDMPDSMQTGWIFAATNNGISRSMDCFCLWSQAGELKGAITALSFDPQRPKHIYAGAGNNLYLTKDGGQSWDMLADLNSTIRALHVTASDKIYVGSQDGRILKSANKAQHWESIDGK